MTKTRLVKATGETVATVEVVKHVEASRGQVILLKVAEWLAGYMSFRNPDDALVLALWAMGTWRFRYLYTYPYLVITKGQPGCGASMLQELLAMLCMNSWRAVTTASALLGKLLEHVDPADPSIGLVTLFRDEAETLNTNSKSSTSEVWNTGYQQGQTIPRRMGKETVEHPAYCPKVLGMIGSSAATIVDRSIILALYKGQPKKLFYPREAQNEGKLIASEIRSVWETIDSSEIDIVYPNHLDTRDQQIWSAMFGLAQVLKLDDGIMTRLVRWSKDNCTWKNDVENLKALVLKIDKDEKWASDAVSDLKRVIADMPKDAKFVLSADAVAKMRELNDGPWRTVHGDGLDPLMLSKLLTRYGLEPKQFRIKVEGVWKVARGYEIAPVVACSGKIEDQIKA